MRHLFVVALLALGCASARVRPVVDLESECVAGNPITSYDVETQVIPWSICQAYRQGLVLGAMRAIERQKRQDEQFNY